MRWKDRILVFRRKRLRFDSRIITAGRLKRWMVVCTSSRIYFYGDEEMVLSRSIKNAVIKSDGVYYQHNESGHVMCVSNPFEPDSFIFYRHGWNLKEMISGVLIVENGGEYLLRNVYCGRHDSPNGVKSSYEDESDVVDGEYDDVNRTRMLRIHRIGSGIRCSVDDCDGEERKNEGLEMRMIEYDNFMVGMEGNITLFVKVGGSRGRVKRNKLSSEMNMRFDRDIEYVMKYRVRMNKDTYLEFLRINETLFLGNEMICGEIDSDLWPECKIRDDWERDYHKPFWSGLNELEMNVLSCCSKSMQKEFFEGFLMSKEKRFDLLKMSNEVVMNINKMGSSWLIRCKNIWEFLSLDPGLNDLPVVSKSRELVNYTYPLVTSTEDVLHVKYRRIMNCDVELVEGMRYSQIMNLAYRIICMELRKNEMINETRRIRSIDKICKAAEKYFGDPRMTEVFSLFNEQPRVFEIDEYDLENKKEKSYILRIASNIGRAYLFYGSNTVKNRYELHPLKFLIHRNDELSEIEIKENGWSDWPSFNYSVYRGCGMSGDDGISYSFIETRIREFMLSGVGNEYVLAGGVFSFGIQNRLDGMDPQTVIRLIDQKYPVISMSLLVGVGMSHIGRKDDALGKMYLYYLKSSQPLYIHVGSIVGLGLLYSGSGNVLIRESLVCEANRDGVFEYEMHNKGNKIWYDHMYRITASFSIAMLYLKVNDIFKFIELNDSLCELLTNGIILFGSKQRRFMKRLRRSDCDRPEEVFYSEFFSLGLMLTEEMMSIVEIVKEKYSEGGIHNLYRLSGRIFYVSVYILYKNLNIDTNDDIFKIIMEICLDSERLMRNNDEFKILFDTCIISLSLITNSSCNLDVIRILRRQIRVTERWKFLSDQVDFFFSTSRCKQEIQFTTRYGDIERYKLCLGVVTCGMGSFKISSTSHLVLNVISTFFINFPIATTDQEYFNMFRYFLILSMKRNEDNFMNTIKYLKMSSRNDRNRMRMDASRINEIFIREYSEASNADKKFIIDVLTEFYEQHGDHPNLLDVELLKNIACRII